MRMRLLLILLVGLAGLGADCGGGGSSHSGGASSSSSVENGSNGEGAHEFAPAVPEPSALLVFGTGVLLAGAATRRKR